MSDDRIAQFLLRSGLATPLDALQAEPLAGGVSSDIWRIDVAGRPICVKGALPILKTAAHWEAPVSRNTTEWEWLRFAHRHMPKNVPAPLAHDPEQGFLAMSYLDPRTHPVWKSRLLSGHVIVAEAAAVGALLGGLHSVSARAPDLAGTFDTLASFRALRLSPYFEAAGRDHPDLRVALSRLSERTAGFKRALVHGDVSPKNILIGPLGPVFLDAECAWYGDPAFDLAFCLNHLLLKCVALPDLASALTDSAEALRTAYLEKVDWEPAEALERRAALLLAGLLLARIDGKSPVEYIGGEHQKNHVRAFAGTFLRSPAQLVSDLVSKWRAAARLLPAPSNDPVQ